MPDPVDKWPYPPKKKNCCKKVIEFKCELETASHGRAHCLYYEGIGICKWFAWGYCNSPNARAGVKHV